ncbi:MAG: hypothetical protein CL869_04620 [Cytophagia bacterium]|nr:hypothetical protein [Cytophagia bacterium]
MHNTFTYYNMFIKRSSNIIACFILLFTMLSCDNYTQKANKIILSIEISGDNKYDEVRLQKVNSDYSIELVKTGNFQDKTLEFEIFVSESTLYRLDFIGRSSIDIILNDTDVSVLIDDNDDLFKYDIEGSPDTNILRSISSKISDYRSEIRELNIEFISANEEKDVQLINSIRENVSFKKNQFELSLKEFLRSVDKSLAVLIFSDYLSIDENVVFWEGIYNNYIDEFKSNSYFINFENKLKKIKSVSVGSIAPEIILDDINGNPISLSSLRGRYVLLDFWAAWCRPCREENPNILENYNRFKDQGFEVYQVSLDRNKEDWLRGIDQDNLPWINVSDLKYYQSDAAVLYNINKIPSAFLLDPNGTIIAKNIELRGINLTKKLSEIFN